jgi:O-acetyl-ADP-ribose deacetylase (regulator of RNase III)
MFVFDTGTFTNPRYIINFPTKRHWKGKSRIEDIDIGLIALAREVRDRSIKSIAIPPLGAGLGGLDWRDVRPRIEEGLRGIQDLDVLIYEPSGAPAVVKSLEAPAITAGRASLVTLMHRYLQGLLDPFVTLIELQKLMYFMQFAGQPLNLSYRKGHYGPYASNLSHVLHAIEGHLVAGYKDGGDKPFKELTIVPGAYLEAESFLSDKPDVQERFRRVSDLVDGFETPYGLELLATVHWVVTQEGARNPEEALDCIYNWNDRKKIFTRRQLITAYQVLESKNWLSSELAKAHL